MDTFCSSPNTCVGLLIHTIVFGLLVVICIVTYIRFLFGVIFKKEGRCDSCCIDVWFYNSTLAVLISTYIHSLTFAGIISDAYNTSQTLWGTFYGMQTLILLCLFFDISTSVFKMSRICFIFLRKYTNRTL